MTETELEIVRLKVRMEVLRILSRALYTGLANTSPTVAQTIRDRFSNLRQEHDKIALKGMTPEMSDLISAEYQEALEDILSSIESGFRS
jgi:hypothetical protein